MSAAAVSGRKPRPRKPSKPRKPSRLQAWLLRRVPREAGPVAITRRRVYILPTRFGWGFALLLIVMLLGATNFSNSLIFLLTFLLAGLSLVCMHHTHANLVNLQLRAGRVAPVFAGEKAQFEFWLDNAAPRPRWSITAQWAQGSASALATVPPAGSAALRLPLTAKQRGQLRAGAVKLSTDFPLGLFRAWTWAELDFSAIVYPAAAAPGSTPPASGGGSSGLAAMGAAGQEEFAGLRGYQPGDALHAVHWKSLPKLQRPMVKLFTDTQDRELWLDWDALPGTERETRLARLTRWVVDAERSGRRYGLRLPRTRIAPGHGERHRHECLRALALFEGAAQ